MWPWSKKKLPPAPSVDLRETLFGDMPLSAFTANMAEPFAGFARAAERLEGGDRAGAIDVLRSIAEAPGLESRTCLQAWSSLRKIGVEPPPEDATRLLGVVIDVPMHGGLDVLAAYADHHARYINFRGGGVFWEAPDARLDERIDALLAEGRKLVSRIGAWKGERPPLAAGCGRISLLTPSGLHFGEGPLNDLTRDAMCDSVMQAATQLMLALVGMPRDSRGRG
jgi:hypothetical protein